MMDANDRELAREAGRLLELHRRQLDAFCARFQDDPHDREELAQLVMIRVWNGFAGFDGRSSFTTWLFRIVRNTAVTEYQRKARRPIPVDLVHESAVPCGASRRVGPEDVVVLRDSLDRALDVLDDRFRRTVELVDRWGCHPSEAAALTGAGDGTVRTRLFRARRSLRAALLAEAA